MNDGSNNNFESSEQIETDIMHDHEGALRGTYPINDNDAMNFFGYPGSGKTLDIIPSVVENGLAKYGRVYATGPSSVACDQLRNSFNNKWPDKAAQLTPDATIHERAC